jgi:aspartate/methionine/tyrosine aminotransferase
MNRINKQSAYMEWAKTSSVARFNLATSGLTNTKQSEFSLAAAETEITGPGGYGYAPLQERLSRQTGAPVECIVAATGASMANYLAVSAVVDPGDEVLIERPAYGLFADIANYLGARIRYFDRTAESDFAVNGDDLSRALRPETRLVIMSNLHNPTGALIPSSTLQQIGGIAQRAGVYVLVDEVYLEMLFDTTPPFAFPVGEQLGRDSNPFVVTNSLTKAYGLSGLRCGWILAAPQLSHRIWRLNDLFGVNAAHLAEQASVLAFDRLDELRGKASRLLRINRELLGSFLDANPELECFRPSAGTVVFPKLPDGDPEVFLELLREKYETTVVPGKFFGMARHFRIGIGGETDMVRGGLERIDAALKEFQQG